MDLDAENSVAGVASDVRLASRAAAGEEVAWRAIVERYLQPVWDLSRRIVRDQYRAEEVAQETFRVVKEKLAEYRGQGSLCGWIQVICRRQALDELRRRSRQSREVSIEDWPGLDGMQGTATEERWVQHLDLERALAALEDDEREVILLSQAGYTSEELARTLGVAATTVRSRKARARQRLVRELEGGYGWENQQWT